MSDAGTFQCKACKDLKPAEAEVVTRYRTRTCKACWGTKVAKGHRHQTGLPADVCLRCGTNPRTEGWGICTPCKRKYRAEHASKSTEQVLTPRETAPEPDAAGKVLIPRETNNGVGVAGEWHG